MAEAPTLELLDWIAARPRTYTEAIEAWGSHCPRLTVWEDAVLGGLVCVGRRRVALTPAGDAVRAAWKRQPTAIV